MVAPVGDVADKTERLINRETTLLLHVLLDRARL